MKRKTVFLSAFLMLMVCGCNQNHSSDTSEVSKPQQQSESASDTLPHIDLSEIQVPKASSATYSNAIEYYKPNEAKEIVAKQTNFKIAPDCVFRVPSHIDHVSTFSKKIPEQDSLYDFYRTYLEMYAYLFPNAEINENNLFYYGKNSNTQMGIEQVKTIGKNFNDYLAEDKTDVYYCFYSPYFYEGQTPLYDAPNRCLELSSPCGTGMTTFNKGFLANYMAEKRQESSHEFLEAYVFPYMFSDFDEETGAYAGFPLKEYPPESDAVHTMLDGKQMSVRDAVRFFENYINTLPYPKNPNLEIQVKNVTTEEVSDGAYCYAFECAATFEGIPFDYFPYGRAVQGNDGYEPTVRMGFMAVTDDVDAAYGAGREVVISDRTDTAQIISYADALKTCEDSLSEYADWELLSAELVYCAGKGRKADPPYQDMEYQVSPSYKFVLYNKNDNICYSAFVSAISGKFERYYKSFIKRSE